MGTIVRLHDGLRALYPGSVVFGAIGTSDAVRGIDRIRALFGMPAVQDDRSLLSIAVDSEGLVIWAQSPLLRLHPGHLAAIGIDEDAMDVTAVVAGGTSRLTFPLAVPAEGAQIADRVLAALSGRLSPSTRA